MKLGLILGDQLSMRLPTLEALSKKDDLLVMAEVPVEATYVKHHKQKIALLFSAMRHHAKALEQAGWQLRYFRYGEHSHQSLLEVLESCVDDASVEQIVVTHCGEYRLQQEITEAWSAALNVDLTCLDDDRFICDLAAFSEWAEGRKRLTMEYFYREMRRKTGLLMEGDDPAGGQWNYDDKNREAYKGETRLVEPIAFERDDIDREVLELVEAEFSGHIGNLETFNWATTRESALKALTHFIVERLPHFGRYQDAMVTGEDFLFHSLLSPYINCGLLAPLDVCEAAEQAWLDGDVPLNAAEGFIRQIIGWREYVRGIYWLLMPDYADENQLGNDRELPAYYWTGDTKMHCMAESFRNTIENGYAHHIQRLMITGNFALLTGIAPKAICEWYLMVYVDAYDWVELPNTLGMVMHADNGYLGSKPYAASGNYIKKMSDYCKHCQYNVNTATESDSCPFNSLYWHFIDRHRDEFADNHRMRMVYSTLNKMNDQKRERTLARADALLANLDSL